MPITQSVGKGGGNIKRDVKYVQALLNVWREQNGRPVIKVDGIAGPKTIGAIEEFQRAKTGSHDGRVDPNAQTIAKLEEQIAALSRQLKAYLTLAMALSYDPNAEHSSVSEFLTMTGPIFRKAG